MPTTFTGAYAGHTLTVNGLPVAGTPERQAWETKITLLERFNGRTFNPVPGGNTAATLTFWSGNLDLINQCYDTLKSSVYSALAIQTRLKPLLDMIGFSVTAEGIQLDFNALNRELDARIATDETEGLADLVDFTAATKSTLQINGWNGWDKVFTYLDAHPVSTEIRAVLNMAGVSLIGSALADVMVGNSSNDTISGGNGNDFIFGSFGNDILYGDDGSDMLNGGDGSDWFYGGNGADRFVFDSVTGVEWIKPSSASSASEDSVEFSAANAIAAKDIELRRFVNNLEIVLKSANGGYQNKTVVIENYFGGYGVKEIRLADGTVLNNPAILEQTQTWGSNGNDTITGYDGGSNRIVSFGGNDTVYGGNLADTINGGDGDDYLSGNAGNDLLNGDAGNDTLVGGDGNDVLNGGDGSDWFYGGNGADRFVFDSVTGVEWIRPSSTSSASEDSVEFSAANAIAAKDIELRRFVNNLEIVLKTANGGYQNKTVVIENYFGGYGVKEIRLADGTVLNNPAILEQTQTWGSNGNDTITGYDGGSNRIVSFGGNDTVYGGNLADTINGGDGDDYLSGNAGNDLLNGDAGNDTLVGGDGNDVLNGGDGSDWFYGGNGADRFVFDSVTGVEWIRPSSTSSASEDSVEFSAACAIAPRTSNCGVSSTTWRSS